MTPKAENIDYLAFYRTSLPIPVRDNYSSPQACTKEFWNLNLKILSFHLKRSVTSFNISSEWPLWKYWRVQVSKKKILKSLPVLPPRGNCCWQFTLYLSGLYVMFMFISVRVWHVDIQHTLSFTSCTYPPFSLRNTSQIICSLRAQ